MTTTKLWIAVYHMTDGDAARPVWAADRPDDGDLLDAAIRTYTDSPTRDDYTRQWVEVYGPFDVPVAEQL